MEKIISDKFGCQIIERENKIFIRYDSGQSASKMMETEITYEEAKLAMLSEDDAYKIIVTASKREKQQT
jgi:hypothetical protein